MNKGFETHAESAGNGCVGCVWVDISNEEGSGGVIIVRERAFANDDVVEQWTECSSLSGDVDVLHGQAHALVHVIRRILVAADGTDRIVAGLAVSMSIRGFIWVTVLQKGSYTIRSRTICACGMTDGSVDLNTWSFLASCHDRSLYSGCESGSSWRKL